MILMVSPQLHRARYHACLPTFERMTVQLRAFLFLIMDKKTKSMKYGKRVVVDNLRDDDGKWLTQRRNGKDILISRSYMVWRSIVARCTHGSREQRLSPNYVGCLIHTDFENFQSFTDWYIRQVGYGLYGYEIDKDILFRGNKLYGPDTCILVPQEINSFFAVKPRRELPIGVSYDAENGLFRACVRVDGRTKHLGRFHTPEEASKIYQIAKKEQALVWKARILERRTPVDARVILALDSWPLPPPLLEEKEPPCLTA